MTCICTDQIVFFFAARNAERVWLWVRPQGIPAVDITPSNGQFHFNFNPNTHHHLVPE